jgi:hypothetical protein
MPEARHRGWIAPLLGVFGLVFVLAAGLWGYAYWANSVPPFRPKLPPMPSPNGYERAMVLAAQLVRPPQLTNWPNGSPAQLRHALRPVRPVLDQVRATFRLQWQVPPALGSANRFAELPSSRECARYFAAESLLAQAEGNDDAAMERCLDAMELGVRMPRGGAVLHALVGVALHAIGFARAEGLTSDLDKAGTGRALARVRRLRSLLPGFVEILEGERISTLADLSNPFSGEGWETPFRALRASWRMLQPPGKVNWPLVPEVSRLWLTPKRKTLGGVNQYFRQVIAESKKPFRTRMAVPIPTDPISESYIGFNQSLESQWWRVEAELALLEATLAVRMHRLQHGRYPDRLTQISREWLPAVPVDPWGQAIRYRLVEGKPVVYSLGPDGKDDGAIAANPRFLMSWQSGDLVFGSLGGRRWQRRR